MRRHGATRDWPMYLGATGEGASPEAIARREGDNRPRDIVVFNPVLEATITPGHGGRLESVFARTSEGDTIAFVDPMLGRRFLGRLPGLSPAHRAPRGAWCDTGGEDDRYAISHVQMGPDFALAVMENEEENSRLRGTRKSYLLPASGRHILVCYRLPVAVDELETHIRLAGPASVARARPSNAVLPLHGDVVRIGEGAAALWVARAHDEAVAWLAPDGRTSAREIHVRIRAMSRHVHLLLGVGEVDDAESADRLRRGAALIHAEDERVWGTTTTGVWLLQRRPDGANPS